MQTYITELFRITVLYIPYDGGSNKMKMRPYRSADLEQIMQIADKAWKPIRKMSREALGDVISDILNPEGDDVSKGLQVKAQIESLQYSIAVCEHDSVPVGFITYRADGVMGQICNNGALPDTGLKGIGQTMYAYVLAEFRKAGVKVVRVTTGLDEAHSPARRAYERAGFRKHLDSTTYYMELE